MPACRQANMLSTPRSHYESFRSILSDLLDRDGSYKAKYLKAEFESKLNDDAYASPAVVRRTAAIEKWLLCEETNRETSSRLIMSDETDFVFLQDGVFPVSIVEVLTIAKGFIADVIGDDVPWDELSGSFSGGASVKIRRGPGAIARKYQEGTAITEAAIKPFLRLNSLNVWAPRGFDLVRGNVMFTVPKSTVIDRCAAKEPELNMYAQKAVGDYIRRKLKRVGIDLNDQSINQELARVGSVQGNLATVDLSSASDSITKQLVLMLLPDEWFYLMDDIRSHETLIDNVAHENFMFSSMGNGFTFELESLIFWALTRAVCYATRTKGRISVYGDDIICPVGIKNELIEVFTFCGFKINTKKSFFDGPFRESCGSHWFEGRNVTPFYVKKVPVDVSDWCLLLNSLRKWNHIIPGISDPDYYDLWELFASEIVPRPVWGGGDMASRANLVSPGRFPIARCVLKKETNAGLESTYSLGAYLHWLDATDGRRDSDAVETSVFTTEGAMRIKKHRVLDKVRNIPLYPQELNS